LLLGFLVGARVGNGVGFLLGRGVGASEVGTDVGLLVTGLDVGLGVAALETANTKSSMSSYPLVGQLNGLDVLALP
jgi:hypothetical protein